jgi:hypothetical protein
MSKPAQSPTSADPKPRGFTNDGKVTSDIVNDSYGTVDPADSTGLDNEEESVPDPGTKPRPPHAANQPPGRS